MPEHGSTEPKKYIYVKFDWPLIRKDMLTFFKTKPLVLAQKQPLVAAVVTAGVGYKFFVRPISNHLNTQREKAQRVEQAERIAKIENQVENMHEMLRTFDQHTNNPH